MRKPAKRQPPVKLSPAESADEVALGVLIYEFTEQERLESEEKIRKRLQRKKMGAMDSARIAHLRELKCEIKRLIDEGSASPYFKKSPSVYVEYADFDIPRIIADLSARYPSVSPRLLQSFVPSCVLAFYLL